LRSKNNMESLWSEVRGSGVTIGSQPSRRSLTPEPSLPTPHSGQEEALLLFQPGPNRFHGPLFVRKLTGLELGIDQVAVDTQLKGTTARRNELQIANLLLVGTQELARQTDGLRLIISHRTVFEFYFHMLSLKINYARLPELLK
jgi:hypothetical protein